MPETSGIPPFVPILTGGLSNDVEPERHQPPVEIAGPEPVHIGGNDTGIVSTEARDLGSVVLERSVGLHARFDGTGLPEIFTELAGSTTAPTQNQYHSLLTAFAGLATPKRAIDALRGAKPFIAETLALFGKMGSSDLMRDKANALARCHIAINTDHDPAASLSDNNEAIRLATAYAKTLGYQQLIMRGETVFGLRDGGEIELVKIDGKDQTSAADLLRAIGRGINQMHFQNDQIVPVDRVPIEMQTRDYSKANAYWSAQVSMLAYADEATATAIAKAWGFKDIRFMFDEATKTRGLVVSGDQGVFVAFEGTSNFSHFKTDINFGKTDAFGGGVHTGFYDAYQSVKQQLSGHLAEIARDREIIFTGHSLGAAIAQLAAVDLVDRNVKVHSIYTFGSPRVGNAGFVHYFNERLGEVTYHHVNDNDAVTGSPPKLFFRYEDGGFHRFTFDSDGVLTRERIEPPPRPRTRMRGLEVVGDVLESVQHFDPHEMERALEEHARAVAQIQGLFASEVGPQLEAVPGLEAMRLFSPVNNHRHKNYVQRLCSEIRNAIFDF